MIRSRNSIVWVGDEFLFCFDRLLEMPFSPPDDKMPRFSLNTESALDLVGDIANLQEVNL